MSRVKNFRWKPGLLLAGFLATTLATTLSLVAPAYAAATCTWTGASTVTCGSETFTSSNGSTTTLTGNTVSGGGGTTVVCPSDTLTISGTSGKEVTYSAGSGGGKFATGSCAQTTTNVTITNTSATAGNGSNATCSSTDTNNNCQGSADGGLSCGSGALSWLVCPVINLAIDSANKMDSFIMNSLDIDVSCIFDNSGGASQSDPSTSSTSQQCDPSTSKGYYTAWNSFRVIATALLVIGGLIMVTSQALGFEMLDAYTVRKVLPRLLVAVIGISLSWPLMRLVILFFDTAGTDIRQLIYTPFQSLGGTLSVTGGLLTTLGAGAAIFLIGPASLTFILTALLGVFVGFVVVIVRQIAIVLLIVIAPVAIACYILPNTQKVWKLWYDNFLGLMLMFPIISGLIAAGHVFAAIALKPAGANGAQGSLVAQATAIVAYFGPYFMLPFAARLATGVIGNIAGFVNDRHKGAFDRLKGARGNAMQKNMHDMKSGSRFSDRNVFTRGINSTTAGIGTGMKGHFGLGERGAQARDQVRRGAAAGSVMKDPAWAPISEDDDALRALTYNNAAQARTALAARTRTGIIAKAMSQGQSETQAVATADAAQVQTQAAANRAVEAAQASVGFGRPQAIAAAQQLGTTGTGYADMEEQARTIARASGGDKTTAAGIAGYNNFINKQKGRYDLAPGAGTLISLANGEIDRRNGQQGNTVPGTPAYHAATVQGARAGDAVTLLRGKETEVENLAVALRSHYERTDITTGEKDLTRRQIGQLLGSRSYASPANQQIVNKHFLDLGIQPEYQQASDLAPGGPNAPPAAPPPPAT